MHVPENVHRGDTPPDPSGYSGQRLTASAPVRGIIGCDLDVAVTRIVHYQASLSNESSVVRFAVAAVA